MSNKLEYTCTGYHDFNTWKDAYDILTNFTAANEVITSMFNITDQSTGKDRLYGDVKLEKVSFKEKINDVLLDIIELSVTVHQTSPIKNNFKVILEFGVKDNNIMHAYLQLKQLNGKRSICVNEKTQKTIQINPTDLIENAEIAKRFTELTNISWMDFWTRVFTMIIENKKDSNRNINFKWNFHPTDGTKSFFEELKDELINDSNMDDNLRMAISGLFPMIMKEVLK